MQVMIFGFLRYILTYYPFTLINENENQINLALQTQIRTALNAKNESIKALKIFVLKTILKKKKFEEKHLVEFANNSQHEWLNSFFNDVLFSVKLV